MIRLALNAPSKSYGITIGRGAASCAGETAAALTDGRKAVIVTDGNVAPLWLSGLYEILSCAGFEVASEVLPAGEGSKKAETVSRLWSAFSRAGITRTDCVFALGGGVVGDVTGFATGTYLRGVPLIQIPTTLLAQVDSSVGGKTGIDLAEGKNLAGIFYQPAAVVCDTAYLDTLPPDVFTDGMAEVIKYGLISDAGLFKRLAEQRHTSLPDDIIAACVDIKRRVVEADEKDTGEREILNFGHTVGHAIEALGGYSRFSHGGAVAVGMVCAARLGESLGISEAGTADAVISAIRLYCLPDASPYGADELVTYINKDKKVRGGRISFVFLKKAGRAVRKKVDLSELPGLLKKII